MDLLFCGYHGSASKSGTDSAVNLHFTRGPNRAPSPDSLQSSDNDSLEGMNPESSAMAAKRAMLSKTTTTKNLTRNTRTVQCSVIVDIDERGSDSNVFYNAGANPASTQILALHSNTPPPPGKQSYPTANLNSCILQSGKQSGSGTIMKKVSRLLTWTAVNSNGKPGREAMTEAGEPNSPADTAEPPRNIIRSLPTESHSQHINSPALTSNMSDNEAATAAEQILIEASA